ncbi:MULTISPECIES: DUF421 domain-containing protein [Brevibacterium]|nr:MULTISPECIES: YetF domain-containing protein [Brevibacterium]WAL39471.1 DUF421 domain-containing protein [Brevibacterium sp. BRM-1]
MNPPGGWGAALAEWVGMDPWRIPITIVSAVGIYLAFLLLVKVFGPRILTAMTSFDAVVVIMFGAVAGRVILGDPPTLAVGIVGLVTLMCMEAAFGAIQHRVGAVRSINARPTVVLAHGRFVEEAVRRAHVSDADVVVALRKAGLARFEQAQCVILEPSGGLSVIRAGERIDPGMLAGVRGAELVLRAPADTETGES